MIMLLRLVVLFFFGATMTSAQFAPGPLELAMMPSGCPPASELAPTICKLMQQNLAFQYKPQLIAPSTYIPPLVLEKCDTPMLEQEIELVMPVDEMKPIIIPEAPILPPITLPKFPVPVTFEDPILSPAAEPCEPAFIPEAPAMSIPVAPELPEFNQIVEVPEIKEPVMSPQLPELPAFVMPELAVEALAATPVAPELHSLELPVFPEIIELPKVDFKPVEIPQSPELPAFVMPELPVRMAEPSMIIEPYLEEQPMHVPVPEYVEPLAALPEAPELHLPEPPVFSEIIDFKPMDIPQSPELSAFVMPELPVRMAEPSMIIEPYFEEQAMHVPVPEYIEPLAALPAAPELHLPEPPVFPEIIDFKPVDIPQSPELPAFVMPELPVRMAELPMIVGPYPQEQPMHVPVPEYIEPLAALQAAPDLHLPEPPVFPEIAVRIPQPPQLPAFVMPELPLPVPEQPMVVEPCSENELMQRVVSVPEFIQPQAPIPAAPGLLPNILPELPVHVDLPTQPIIQKMFAKEPCATGELILTKAEPVFIPEPSRVPEFMMPEPIHLEIRKPIFPAYHEAVIIADPCEPSSHSTIQMSDLAPYFVRNTPYEFGKGKFLSLPYEYMHRF